MDVKRQQNQRKEGRCVCVCVWNIIKFLFCWLLSGGPHFRNSCFIKKQCQSQMGTRCSITAIVAVYKTSCMLILARGDCCLLNHKTENVLEKVVNIALLKIYLSDMSDPLPPVSLSSTTTQVITTQVTTTQVITTQVTTTQVMTTQVTTTQVMTTQVMTTQSLLSVVDPTLPSPILCSQWYIMETHLTPEKAKSPA